ncbi:MAG: hypothetical protein JNJ55_07410 [Betaproteobacteria bacterium]|nr:hypothetical protein [Betaproteobacteria bacterium]
MIKPVIIDGSVPHASVLSRLLRVLAWVFLLLALTTFAVAALLTFDSNREPEAAEVWRNSVLTEGVVIRKWVQPSPSGNDMARAWVALRFWTGTAQSVEVSAELDSPRTWRNLSLGDRLMLRYQPSAPDRVRLMPNWNSEFIGDEERVILSACGVLMLILAGSCWAAVRRRQGAG